VKHRGARSMRALAAVLALATAGASPSPPAATNARDNGGWGHIAAVPDRILLGLLSPTADTDIVSPAGIDAVLCALVPVMSDSARRQRRAASESECRPPAAYIARSIWFDRSMPIDPRAAPLLRPNAELFFEPGPVNAGIGRWLDAHHALRVPLRRPLLFAAVSALDYARGWEFPFNHIDPLPFVFHGRKRDERVRFLAGRQLASVGDRSCVRGVMPLSDGGAVLVTTIGSAPVSAAVRCLSRELDPRTLVNAYFFIPQLTLRRTGSIVDRLRRLGLTDIFDVRTNPFPKLFRGHIGEALQAAELTMDWKGIRVHATTIVDTPLAGPKFEAVVAYDHPFALRVVDERGATVAIALVNDL
jgi:hypothetical protein